MRGTIAVFAVLFFLNTIGVYKLLQRNVYPRQIHRKGDTTGMWINAIIFIWCCYLLL